MTELKPCRLCGGKAELMTQRIETDFGNREGVAMRCTGCGGRTYLYMHQDAPEVIKAITDLWNRGCIGRCEG